ncbi:hypothetical protein TVAG_147810 [Trichomonas vaginalis G3]|uniref:Uncharacterized protein n=1 Tax=Trichomonas vaginalis (strain ATCC PRA-98 / G3) TaxID=412133 RepID=A2FVD1_TRIV3|nr:hypothetical protein TVAGG3_0403530 [Trichomonas vaginalis G3]EAX91134.1 hypothetical protein TVAG_147810 [Trichomonas vaginalis G3]KAI5534869.1 hypothetical protein TVAGG3_0403530 [Trichomonas vaginalis G3]|eukprot:XP_001304064.1 hypothetical protein [Trichomonas vaginalis G3]
MTAKQAKEVDDNEMHPPLEDFTVVKPLIRFYDYKKLAETSKNVMKLSQEITNFKAPKVPNKFLWPKKSEIPPDDFVEDEETSVIEPIDQVETNIVEIIPPLAASKLEYDFPATKELNTLAQIQRKECFDTSNLFEREEWMALSNYYDAQIRENTQRNEIVDKRPISDALRYTSKLSAFPIDVGGQKFYKYNIRCEKMEKRHKRTMEKISQAHDHASDALMNHHIHWMTAFGDIQKINVENVKIPKIPIQHYE